MTYIELPFNDASSYIKLQLVTVSYLEVASLKLSEEYIAHPEKHFRFIKLVFMIATYEL